MEITIFDEYSVKGTIIGDATKLYTYEPSEGKMAFYKAMNYFLYGKYFMQEWKTQHVADIRGNLFPLSTEMAEEIIEEIRGNIGIYANNYYEVTTMQDSTCKVPSSLKLYRMMALCCMDLETNTILTPYNIQIGSSFVIPSFISTSTQLKIFEKCITDNNLDDIVLLSINLRCDDPSDDRIKWAYLEPITTKGGEYEVLIEPNIIFTITDIKYIYFSYKEKFIKMKTLECNIDRYSPEQSGGTRYLPTMDTYKHQLSASLPVGLITDSTEEMYTLMHMCQEYVFQHISNAKNQNNSKGIYPKINRLHHIQDKISSINTGTNKYEIDTSKNKDVNYNNWYGQHSVNVYGGNKNSHLAKYHRNRYDLW